ncbi:hypothetical protein F5883DRAFT_168041 [Diaporthe sp. PMI_573]|nr:hypothetical protein F5883DRAFT_168041 [Diaporthaceae sp. PMI_573]
MCRMILVQLHRVCWRGSLVRDVGLRLGSLHAAHGRLDSGHGRSRVVAVVLGCFGDRGEGRVDGGLCSGVLVYLLLDVCSHAGDGVGGRCGIFAYDGCYCSVDNIRYDLSDTGVIIALGFYLVCEGAGSAVIRSGCSRVNPRLRGARLPELRNIHIGIALIRCSRVLLTLTCGRGSEAPASARCSGARRTGSFRYVGDGVVGIAVCALLLLTFLQLGYDSIVLSASHLLHRRELFNTGRIQGLIGGVHLIARSPGLDHWLGSDSIRVIRFSGFTEAHEIYSGLHSLPVVAVANPPR